MREGAKQRLVGATVIVALAVIFVPMFFEEGPADAPPSTGEAPAVPAFDPKLKSEVFLGPGDSGVGGLDSSQLTDSLPLALPDGGEAGTDAGPSAGEASEPPPEAEALPPEPTGEESAPTTAEPKPATGANDGMPSWVIQVASVATSEGAAEMESKLRANGFSAFVEKALVNGKTYYRVRVGPEVDRGRAEKTAARLRDRLKLATLIQNYP